MVEAKSRKRARVDTSTTEVEDGSPSRTEESLDHSGIAGTVLAIASHQHKLAAAYHDFDRSCLFLLEDTLDNDKYDLAAMIVEQVKPTCVLTSSRSDPALIQRLKETLAPLQDRMEEEITIVLRPRGEWQTMPGLRSLQNLRIHDPNLDDHSDDQNDLQGGMALSDNIRLGSFVSIHIASNPIMLGAVACLFGHHRRNTTAGEMPNPDGIVDVTSVERIQIHKMLHINAAAQLSLQIFADEAHANVYSDKVKEGLSIFGILKRTCTPAGELLLRHWLLRPSTDLRIIRARQDAIDCFSAPENDACIKDARKAMRGIKNLSTALAPLKGGRGKHTHWRTVLDLICSAVAVRDALCMLKTANAVSCVNEFLQSFTPGQLRELANHINQTVDWEESKVQGRICIKPQIDDELDQYREDLAALPSKLTHIATKLSQGISPDFADNLNIVYFPQLGYLLTVPFKSEWKNPQDHMPNDDWTFQFGTEVQTYWKTSHMRDLDAHLGDLDSLIASREIELAHDLLQRLENTYETTLRIVGERIAELDCLFAFAEVAKLHRWVRPIVTVDNVCRIQGGRHPLVECCVDQYVANDTVLSGGMGRTEEHGIPAPESRERSLLVVTGANGSGKSIYLKAVALIVFLAHCGSFVPADAAEIGLTDSILTRVSARESASLGASAFTLDLQQVSYMLRNCTKRSLLIIDEFGKGTDTTDGEGLFVGLLQHLVDRGDDMPKALLATHFHSVFCSRILDPELPILRAHMKLLIQEETDSATITYLFQLANGLATTSHASQCARVHGISDAITKRAEHVSSCISEHAIHRLLDVALSADEVAEMEACSMRVRQFLNIDLDGPAAKDVKRALGEILGV